MIEFEEFVCLCLYINQRKERKKRKRNKTKPHQQMGHPQGTKTQGDMKVIRILCRAISVFLFRFRIIFYLFSFNMLHIIYIAYDTKQKVLEFYT